MVTPGMLWKLAVFAYGALTVAASAVPKALSDPVEAVSWCMRPSNPLAGPLISTLGHFADQNLRIIFSCGDTVDTDVSKALQYFVSMRADTEMYGCCGSTTRLQDRFDNVKYMDGSWRERLGLLSPSVDLLHFPIPNKVNEKDIVAISSDLNEACKRVTTKTGLLFVDNCKGNEMMCRVLEYFAGQNGFVKIDNSDSAITMKRSGQIIEDSFSVAAQRPSLDSTIIQLLSQGNLRALFMNVMSNDNQRYAGWLKVANMVKQRNLKNFLQTGPMRPNSEDGKATVVLARLAKMVSGMLTLVDTNAFDYAMAMTAIAKEHIRFIRDFPVSFMSHLSEQYDLLYLNSLDFDNVDNGPAQQYRWAEVNFARDHLSRGAVVVLDNCDLLFEGPCKMATSLLTKDMGMKMVQEGPLRIFSASMDEQDLIQVNRPKPPAPRPPQQPQPQSEQQPERPPAPAFEPNREIEEIFRGLMNDRGHRYASFRKVAELAVQRKAKTMVETGTARNGVGNCGGDGCSTAILGRLARLLGARLHTVDISASNIDGARQGTADLAANIEYHVSDSIAFLAKFKEPIDVLYLDSYDYDGIEYGPSQRHHLKELEAAWDKVHDNTIIFLDDCALSYEGKCKMASQFLRQRGWRLLIDAYQRVYVRY